MNRPAFRKYYNKFSYSNSAKAFWFWFFCVSEVKNLTRSMILLLWYFPTNFFILAQDRSRHRPARVFFSLDLISYESFSFLHFISSSFRFERLAKAAVFFLFTPPGYTFLLFSIELILDWEWFLLIPVFTWHLITFDLKLLFICWSADSFFLKKLYCLEAIFILCCVRGHINLYAHSIVELIFGYWIILCQKVFNTNQVCKGDFKS